MQKQKLYLKKKELLSVTNFQAACRSSNFQNIIINLSSSCLDQKEANKRFLVPKAAKQQ